MTARPPLDPDPLVAPGFIQDDVAESIAVDLFRRYGRGAIGRDGRGSYDWRSDAYLLVNRIRYLDGHQSDGRGILIGLLLAAISGAIATLVAVAVVSAAAPRSAATAIPVTAATETRAVSGNPSLPPGAPWVGSPGGAPNQALGLSPTQEPGEIGSAMVGGIAAYAVPSYGSRYLAIPEGPGVRVRICSQEHGDRCVIRVSTDAGPDLAMQRAGRVADLSYVDFATLCGCDPRIRGTMPVTIEYSVGNPTPPATDP